MLLYKYIVVFALLIREAETRFMFLRGGSILIVKDIIVAKYSQLNDTEKMISNYLINHSSEIPTLSTTELAQKVFTSKSTISRFAQKLGFSGFTEMKHKVNWSKKPKENEQVDTKTLASLLTSFLDSATIKQEELFSEILKAKRIYILGTGTQQSHLVNTLSEILLKHGIVATALTTNRTTVNNKAFEFISSDDLLLIFSHSGNNDDLKNAVITCELNHPSLISFVSTPTNWLTNHSNMSFTLTDSENWLYPHYFYFGFFSMLLNYLDLSLTEYLLHKNLNGKSDELK